MWPDNRRLSPSLKQAGHEKGRLLGGLFLGMNGTWGQDLDLVADHALHFAFKFLAFATTFLQNAFGLQAFIARYLARSLLDVAYDFIAQAFGLVI